ncbi:MAG TPA: aminotransferase class III-fold pyridoxal phosphate-dependent enzyme [Gemmatimonadaceae bacterium]|nr:aminotransferase class III-fold pyridoxal phosphate-dependent enzyme [Gemmatimonadaceae bacterium]
MAFFRSRKPTAPTSPEPAAQDDTPEADEATDRLADEEVEGEGEVGFTEEDAAREWRDRAEAVLPGGSSTGSKRAAALFGPDDLDSAAHFLRATGCEIQTVGGERLVDCTMALGAVALGYADPAVTQNVVQAASAGNVAGMSSVLEVQLAERLCDVIPCAEQVRFLKTGAEGCAAAIRIARTATGRSRVVGAGYFGWLDWWTTDAAGVPTGAHGDFSPVPFDDLLALERAASAAGGDLAAVILEPFVERPPSEGWLAGARAICERTGAVLIFDEMKTGFRVRTGGWQEYAAVEPDLAVFGKALANGYPLAAVVGRAAIMEAAGRTWISSTLAGETTALAAAMAVLDRHDEEDVCAALWSIGESTLDVVRAAVSASGVRGVSVEGIAPMWMFRFDDPTRQDRFLRLARNHGALFKRGAYNYAALAHDEEAIAAIERAASSAFVELVEQERDGR